MFLLRGRALARSFSTSVALRDAVPKLRPSPKDFAIKDPKVIAKRQQAKRAAMREPPQSSPLYMDVATALKYIRASEAGQPAKKTTITLQIQLGPEKGSPKLSGEVCLPRPVKAQLALVFTQSAEQAERVRAVDPLARVGGAELVEQIQDGMSLDSFSIAFATPEMLTQLQPILRTLGPRGLAPSAKVGTVGPDVEQLVRDFSGRQLFKQKKDMLAFTVGRCDFSDADVLSNIKAVSDVVYLLQPAGTKHANVIGPCYISSTQSPSVVIDIRP